VVKHDINVFFPKFKEELNASFMMLVLNNMSALHIKDVLPVNVESIFPKFRCICWLINWESWSTNHTMSMWSGLWGGTLTKSTTTS
jgi:hypothetical protein